MDTLIKLLKQNARLSCKELAAMTDMSEADVEKKIREYEHSGIIKGYSAIVADDADEDSVTAFIEVKVTPKADCGFDDIAQGGCLKPFFHKFLFSRCMHQLQCTFF